MKNTLWAPMLVRIATRSPVFSSAGAEVECNSAPISVAMIAASVVLPSPGGPLKNT